MGHGFLEFRLASLLNCRESYLRNIGDTMQASISDADFAPLQSLVSAWQHELETMPLGCFGFRLSEHLQSSDDVARFVRLLTGVIERLKNDPEKSNTLAEALRIRDFVRSQNAEPGAALELGPAFSDR